MCSPWCSESAHEYIAQWLRIPSINVTNAAVLHKELFDSSNASTYYGALKSLSAADGVRNSALQRCNSCESYVRISCGTITGLISLSTIVARVYSHEHVRRESLRSVHRSRTILCRPVPNSLRSNDSQLFHFIAVCHPPVRSLTSALRSTLLTNRGVQQLRMEAARYFSWTYSVRLAVK